MIVIAALASLVSFCPASATEWGSESLGGSIIGTPVASAGALTGSIASLGARTRRCCIERTTATAAGGIGTTSAAQLLDHQIASPGAWDGSIASLRERTR